jgi:hypothetical protein
MLNANNIVIHTLALSGLGILLVIRVGNDVSLRHGTNKYFLEV